MKKKSQVRVKARRVSKEVIALVKQMHSSGFSHASIEAELGVPTYIVSYYTNPKCPARMVAANKRYYRKIHPALPTRSKKRV